MNNDELDIESLIVFAQVVRDLSISRAAKKLGRSKQSVHRQIKDFEESLSVKLLQKDKRNITPTKAGQRLYQHAEKIIEEARAISEFLKMPKLDSAMTIRITAPPLLAEIFLSSIIKDFLKSHPKAQIECLLTNDIMRLDDNNIDLAIRIGSARQSGLENYQSTTLGLVSRIVCATPKYVQDAGHPKQISDLKSHRTLHYGTLNEFRTARWQLGRPVEVSPVLSASSPHVILDAVLNHQGVAMLPELMCSKLLRQGQLIELLPQHRLRDIPITLLARSNLSQNSMVSQFIKKIVDTGLGSSH